MTLQMMYWFSLIKSTKVNNSHFTSLRWFAVCLGLISLVMSCDSTIHNIKDYYQYINNEANGLIKQKKIGSIAFVMKYIPTDFFVYKASAEESKDSLKEAYEGSLNFILKVAPSEEAETKFDVMTETVSSLDEFKQQAFTVNFELQKFIRLKIGDREISPVLVETENVYGLTQHRLVNIVFAKEMFEEAWATTDKIDIVFNDEIYNTGKHHFLFYKNDLESVPKLDL